jgi:hypothetical protein
MVRIRFPPAGSPLRTCWTSGVKAGYRRQAHSGVILAVLIFVMQNDE